MPSYAVIGGSRGIGLEFVRQLASDPANTVFVTVRNKATSTHLNSLISSLKPDGKNMHVLQADVVDHRQLKVAAEEVARVNGGTLDVLIHNAARMENANLYRGLTDYLDEDQLDAEFIQSFRVNALGVIHSVNAFLPLLRKGSTKKIVIVSSGGGERETVWNLRIHSMAAYGTTKAAANMIATKYAALLENEGFVVVSLSPGLVDVSATAVDERDEAANADLERQMVRFREAKVEFDTPEHSVKQLLKTIASVGPEDTGTYKRFLASV